MEEVLNNNEVPEEKTRNEWHRLEDVALDVCDDHIPEKLEAETGNAPNVGDHDTSSLVSSLKTSGFKHIRKSVTN